MSLMVSVCTEGQRVVRNQKGLAAALKGISALQDRSLKPFSEVCCIQGLSVRCCCLLTGIHRVHRKQRIRHELRCISTYHLFSASFGCLGGGGGETKSDLVKYLLNSGLKIVLIVQLYCNQKLYLFFSLLETSDIPQVNPT